jgi:hypothetical protein
VGGTRRLYLAGHVECWQPWQGAVFAYLALLTPLPFVVYRLKLWLDHRPELREAADVLSKPVSEPNNFSRPLCRSVRKSFECVCLLRSQYTAERSYWESVLMGRRWVLIVLATFISDPFLRALSLTLACCAVAGLHLYARPFQRASSQAAETVSLTLLVVLGAISVRTGAYASAGTASVGPVALTTRALDVIQVRCQLLSVAVVGACMRGVVRNALASSPGLI